MRKTNILFYLLFSYVSYAQMPNIQWEKTFGGNENEIINSMILENDTNVLFTGFTESSNGYITTNHGFNDVWLLKMDMTGNLIWNKCFGGQGDEEGLSISSALNGNYIISAIADYNDGEVTGIHGGFDYWILSLNDTGAIRWAKCFGGIGWDFVSSVIQTSDSGYFISGYSDSNDFDVSGNWGSYDVWVLKIDSIGNIQWSKNLGGSGYDAVEGYRTCIQTNDHGYLIIANTGSNDINVSGYHGNTDIWVLKLDSAGNLMWQKCYGGSAGESSFSILVTENNSFYVSGLTQSNDGDVNSAIGGGDYWLFKADSNGTIQWEKCYGGMNFEILHAICNTSDGGLALAGFAFGDGGQVSGTHGWKDIWVVKVDSVGNFEWGKALGGTLEDEANAILEMPDGGLMVAGYTNSNDGDVTFNHGGSDAWVVKLSPPGLSINDPEYSIMDLAIFQQANSLTTRFFSRVNEQVQMEIYNITGKKVSEQSIRVTEGINYFDLPGNYKTGSYCLKICGRKFSQSKVFVVVNE